MMNRIDRVVVAVKNCAQAARTFHEVLGAEVTREAASKVLGAKRTIMALGESEVELCEPDGSGLVADFLAARGEGLLAGGLSTHDPEAVVRRAAGLGLTCTREGEQVFLEPEENFGLRLVVSPSRPRSRVGLASFLYEITNSLASDWRGSAAHFAALFDLDPARFHGISSERFGYVGSLTLFNPPERLDRIELSQTCGTQSAMGRWVARNGDSLYMCYCETHDLPGIMARLNARGARWTPRGASQEGERDGLWVHPSVLHGVLLGVSRTTLSWQWSGRPELVVPAP